MNPMQLSMLQHALQIQQGRQAFQQATGAGQHGGNHQVAQSFVDPRATALMGQTQNMDIAQKYLFAQANRIMPQQLGLTPGQIYAAEQGLAGITMDRQTGQIRGMRPDGSPLQPGDLMGLMNSRLGGGIYAGQPAGTGASGTYDPSSWGSNPAIAPNWNSGSGSGVSNVGGGAGNPNNAAGGLYGSAGNALRQMFMGSQQFNPNGANTYAIQNMNLSGQGDLGSNMGGTPSNNLFGGAVNTGNQTATSIGNQTNNAAQVAAGQPIPQQLGSTSTQMQGALGTLGSTGTSGGMGLATPQTTQTKTPSYFGGAMTSTPQPQAGGHIPSQQTSYRTNYLGGNVTR